MTKIRKFFKIEERQSTIKREIVGGITTFLAMAYILFVNPSILSATGMDPNGVFLATALAAAFATFAMALLANLPIALAPGMGLNAFFAFTLVIGMGLSWEKALAAVLVSGVLYLIISLVGLRKLIVKAIPQSLKYAVGAGIGFFIAFIGLTGAGIIQANPDTYVALGDLSNPTVLLALFGILLTVALLSLKVKGAILFGMLGTAVLGIIIGLFDVQGMPEFGGILSADLGFHGLFGKAFSELGWVLTHGVGWLAIISFLFVDFFDTAGTLLSVTNQMEFLTEKDIDKANIVDATSTIAGAVLGTSTTTSYIESLSGTAAGARTGLASIVTGLLFVLAIFFSPLLSVVTSAVTACAMVIVGVMMTKSLGKIEWDVWPVAFSAFITIIFMILTYSISNGIGFGFIAYVVAMLCSKKAKEIHWMMYVVSGLFVVYYILTTLFL
ncbi:MAG: NCS2 family permease [Bacilli bacterium]|nr:NCS2 family permease [Bacilli bacterium]